MCEVGISRRNGGGSGGGGLLTYNVNDMVLYTNDSSFRLCWTYMRLALSINYTLITNLMHWLLFIRKILLSSTCFEHQVLIFRRT